LGLIESLAGDGNETALKVLEAQQDKDAEVVFGH